jgi:hypothetical protein
MMLLVLIWWSLKYSALKHSNGYWLVACLCRYLETVLWRDEFLVAYITGYQLVESTFIYL